jgi:hypothetical protein
MRYAFGTLRLTPDVFYRMTHAEYLATVEGFEIARQHNLAPFRHFCSYLLASNGAKIKASEIMRLPMIDKHETSTFDKIVNDTLEYARKLKAQRNGRIQGHAGSQD